MLAILMFVGSAAWVLLTTLGVLRAGIAEDPGALMDATYGAPLFLIIMTMMLAPKLASLIDALVTARGRRSFGGGARLALGSATELVFSTLLSPVMAIAHTVFIAGLPFGKALVWEPQRRGGHRVSLTQALERLWPQTLVGLISMVWMVLTLGSLAAWLSPFFLGAMLAAPIAVLSASPWLGAQLARIGLWRIPEEVEPPPIVRALDLPAVDAARRSRPLAPQPMGGAATETAE
jgi:membrane glycosyltransferase